LVWFSIVRTSFDETCRFYRRKPLAKEVKVSIMSSINKRIFIFGILFIFSISTVFAQTEQNRTSRVAVSKKTVAASLTTEKNAYLQGETAVIRGTGFSGYEQITVRVEQFDEQLRQDVLRATWAAFADDQGNFVSNWEVPFNARFTIKAAGDQSGRETQTVIASASVTPVFLPGNPNCGTLNASNNPAFAHITSNWGFKVDNPPTGNYPFTNGGIRELTGGAPAEPGSTLSITRLSSTTIDWSSNRQILAVIVKAGSNANVYPYNPGVFGDTLLTASGQNGISHIEVCYDKMKPADITIIKDAQPNSPQAFNFTAGGQVTQNFSLVDNGVVGPDRITFSNLNGLGAANSITITEGASAPFSLIQINCTSNGTGLENNAVNVPARFTTIVLEEGESVVCRFVNAITTAASLSIGGRTTDARGKGLARTQVTIQNIVTGETQTVYTNSFGYYRADNLPAGDFYIVSVSNKRFVFLQPTKSFMLNEAVENLDFTASPQ
jgi:hypothetical protein